VAESLAQTTATTTQAWVLEIEQSLRQRDPDVFIVLPRVLRRVMRHALDITRPWVRIPHRKSYVIDRERLTWLVALDELGVAPGTELPHRAMLIARPEEDRLARFTPDKLRHYYWRLHFHARIDLSMSERVLPDHLSTAQLRRRIDRIGQQQFDEIRAVLRQEWMLTNPDQLRHVYAEFVAVFHELRAFAPDLLPLYFPSLTNLDQVARLLREDIDAEALLEWSRPPEFAGVDPAEFDRPTPVIELTPEPPEVPTVPRSPRRFLHLQQQADRLRSRGNVVRAAMLRRRAWSLASAAEAPRADAALQEDVRLLAERLQSALELTDEEKAAWQQLLPVIVVGAVREFWNANARLLYDLQKVCIDHERETYRVDLWRWILSLGRTPLRRPLPRLRVVLISKHLRSATRRVPLVRIDPEGRRALTDLLHRAAEKAEHILRSRLHPVIGRSLSDAGIVGRDLIETVALQKLGDELLDGVVERGFLTLGNLRDALSRSQWKLPDLADAREFARGDALLRADQHFAVELDGVYQRGPFYLRWLQRMTSLFFGTPTGRFITRYFALPFGGSYVILKGLHFLAKELHHFVHTPEVTIYSHTAMLGLGTVLFALIHWPAALRVTWKTLVWLWRIGKFLIVDVPHFLYQFPPIAWMLRSLPALIFRRYLLSPVLVTLMAWQVLPRLGLYPAMGPWWALAVFTVSFIILNSRLGRDTEELLFEWLGKAWHRFRVTVIIGLFNWIVDVFRQVMDVIERLLYSVDEWLRFRRGESRLTLALKAVLGLVWSFVHAIIRFCVTLLIEPQVNPIKHFPVVTVSHKLILPSVAPLSAMLANFTDKYTAGLLATMIVTCIPGVFGFLAWELKENWGLYAANRSRTLRPVIIGSHGETLLRLLKPGFHSGTIPKLFARRRRVARKSRHQPELSRHSAYDERLHHEAEAVRHFVERELLGLLRASQRFGRVPLAVADVQLSTNRLDVWLVRADRPDEPACLTFAEQSGWLVAGLTEAGWIRRLTREEETVLSAALAGLYKLGAVDLVREHLERKLGSPPHPYDITESGLVIWPTPSYDLEINYSLKERPYSTPRPRGPARIAGFEPVPISALVFREHPIEWSRWRDFWQAEVAERDCPSPLLREAPVLRA
jgi:hypothetical protein